VAKPEPQVDTSGGCSGSKKQTVEGTSRMAGVRSPKSNRDFLVVYLYIYGGLYDKRGTDSFFWDDGN
jgi:hypothetical protein